MQQLKNIAVLALTLLFIHTESEGQCNAWNWVGNAGFSADSALYIDLAIDGHGTPYVVYRDAGNGNKASVMKFNGSNWVVVGTAGFSVGAVAYTNIAIDSGGVPYVVFEDAAKNNKATVMKYNGSAWVLVGTEGFSSTTALYTDIAIDSGGTPYVVYCSQDTFHATVMKYNGSAWAMLGSGNFSGNAAYSTIAINGSGAPYITYEDSNSKATAKKYNGSNWVTIGAPSFSTAGSLSTFIALNRGGTPYVSYRDNPDTSKVTVMNYNGSSWANVGQADFGGPVLSPTLAIDSSGTPYVSYRDGSLGDHVTVKKFDGSGWVNVGLAGFSATPILFYSSIAIDHNGIPYVAYCQDSNSIRATVMRYLPYTVPTISISAPNTTICAGIAVTFTSTTNITGASYQWFVNNIAMGSNSNTFSYAPMNLDMVKCVITMPPGGCFTTNTDTSNTLTFTVNPVLTPTLSISATPGTTISAGQSDTFTAIVNNAGPNPNYQWTKNGNAIPGAVSNPYITSTLSDGDTIGCTVHAHDSCAIQDSVMKSNKLLIHITTGIVTIANTASEVSVSPNPNKGSFTLRGYICNSGNASIEVSNIVGQVLYKNAVDIQNSILNSNVNLQVPAGVYILSVKTKASTYVNRLLVQ